MNSSKGSLLLLLSLLLLAPACDSSSMSELPVISQFLPPTATATPLPTPTLTITPSSTPFVTFTATPSPSVTDTPSPTATLPPASRPPVTGIEIARGNTERPWMALTFDAGADSAPLPSILETLRQANLRCTFFVTGDWVRKNSELLQEIVADGHELGNHSNTHPRFAELSDEEMAQELAAVEELVVQLTGQSTKPYFRPPFGNRDDRVRRVVQENGYITIYWTYQVWDWVGDRTAEEVFNYAVGDARNGAIVVMHVGAQETADALPRIIEELRARGYRLVTLSELLAS
ncbi:MAG: polysaccharide deacetylase family protein [Anaerolineae bacterium]